MSDFLILPGQINTMHYDAIELRRLLNAIERIAKIRDFDVLHAFERLGSIVALAGFGEYEQRSLELAADQAQDSAAAYECRAKATT